MRDPYLPRQGSDNVKPRGDARDATASRGPNGWSRSWDGLTQPYYDKGKAEGEAKGEAKILTRLLERRFGTLPGALRQRIFRRGRGIH